MGSSAFERRRERIRETPNRSRPELLVLGFEVQIVHSSGQVFWSFQFALHERFADHHFRGDIS